MQKMNKGIRLLGVVKQLTGLGLTHLSNQVLQSQHISDCKLVPIHCFASWRM